MENIKKMFVQNSLPGNFHAHMRVEMYHVKEGSMNVAEFKAKFKEHATYFPSWIQADRVEFFVEALNKSIKYLVNAHDPKTEEHAFKLACNFERQQKTNGKGKDPRNIDSSHKSQVS